MSALANTKDGSKDEPPTPPKAKKKFRARSSVEIEETCFQVLVKLLEDLATCQCKMLKKHLIKAWQDTIKVWKRRWQRLKAWHAAKKRMHELRVTDITQPHPVPCARRIGSSERFEGFGNFVIFLNTFVIGWQAGLTPKVITDTDRTVSFILENVFTFAFSVELTIRTLCWGWTYLIAKENLLDVFLVFLGVLTTWIFGPFGIEVATLRRLTALRTLRLSRLARSVRLRPEFKEMWALMKGLTESGETLLWTYVMIACVLYFFAIMATSLIGKQPAFADNDLAQEYFGDVVLSMLSLFQLMTLDSWTGFARPLMEVQVWVAGFFLIFIAVAVFVMLNLVTAVIVENAFSDSKVEEKEIALRLEREKEEELEDLKQFFMQIDLDGSGSLTKSELFGAVKIKKVRQKLRALDIMPKDIDELWDILDDGNGELDADEFVHGIRRLRGEAKAKDVLRLYKELRSFETAVEAVETKIKTSRARMENIKAQLTRCRSDVAAFQRTMMRAKEAVKVCAQSQNFS
eukprot:TRINITY_DN18367_c0_g1_i1.p1 TRINITY_DN18367_c0_g1~~TRINITY_DN18367_c0_g1_i1.p1  ORF type:complete len:517 (+),score=79.09 TRINITY_DN18367_c0_g1_i1:69-1619(+)